MPTRAISSSASDAVKRMTIAAKAFLDSLDDEQRRTASFEFAGIERYEWAYTPIDRNGLLVSDMSNEQRDAAFVLMETGYSQRGSATAHRIIELETILGEWEGISKNISQWERSPERYWFSVFGVPGSVEEPWGFRVGGHLRLDTGWTLQILMEMVNQTLAQQVIPHQSMVDEPVISTMQNRIQSWSMRVTWEWVMIQFI